MSSREKPVAFKSIAFAATGDAVARLIRNGLAQEKAPREQVINRGIYPFDQRCFAIDAPMIASAEDHGTRTVGVIWNFQAEPLR
jgi:hypothetical protein